MLTRLCVVWLVPSFGVVLENSPSTLALYWNVAFWCSTDIFCDSVSVDPQLLSLRDPPTVTYDAAPIVRRPKDGASDNLKILVGHLGVWLDFLPTGFSA